MSEFFKFAGDHPWLTFFLCTTIVGVFPRFTFKFMHRSDPKS